MAFRNMKARLFALAHGCGRVRQSGVWHGYHVFEPTREPSNGSSLPVVILASSSEVRFARGDEVFTCLNGLIS